MGNKTIRVLVVDDTVVYRRAISDLLKATEGIEVVGVAANGKIALQKCEQLHPDLLTLDLEMPEMDGLDVLRRLQAEGGQIGAIMLSAVTTQGAESTIQALKLGAFDFVVKPTGSDAAESAEALRRDLVPLIRTYARTRLIQNILGGPTGASPPAPAKKKVAPVTSQQKSITRNSGGKPEIVAIGISTGGPQALGVMLPNLPADFSAPVLVVQHMPPLFTRSLAEGLDEKCALSIREAVHGECVRTGDILIAPGGKQMKLERSGSKTRICITDDPPENSCRPSVDYLFRSIAHTYGPNALGVIMTGMGNDGSLGCRLMKRKGAKILTQDETSCVVYGMPKQPAEEGLSDVVVPLERIAGEITRVVGRKMAVCK